MHPGGLENYRAGAIALYSGPAGGWQDQETCMHQRRMEQLPTHEGVGHHSTSFGRQDRLAVRRAPNTS